MYTDSAIKTGEDTLSLSDNIEKVKLITTHIEKLSQGFTNDAGVLKDELNKVKDEKLKAKGDYELRLKRLNERFVSLQNMDTSAMEEKMKGMYNKIVSTELELTQCKAKNVANTKENELLISKLDMSCDKNNVIIIERNQLKEQVEQLKAEIERSVHLEHCTSSTNKILEDKLSELQKINSDLNIKSKEAEDKVMSLDSQLRIRNEELESLKNAFQQSTGYVVGSFKELKEELNGQLLEKSKDMKSMSSINDSLLEESKSLVTQNVELKTKVDTLEEKLHNENKMRGDLEKGIQDKKDNLAVVMRHKDHLASCMQDIWSQLHSKTEDNKNKEEKLV